MIKSSKYKLLRQPLAEIIAISRIKEHQQCNSLIRLSVTKSKIALISTISSLAMANGIGALFSLYFKMNLKGRLLAMLFHLLLILQLLVFTLN